jgi:anti-anti-sigma factor
VLTLGAAENDNERAALAIAVHAAGDTLLVQLVGELDLATVPRLASCLRDLRGRAATVAVDLAGVSFIDLGGLRALFEAQLDAHVDGGELRIATPGPAYARLLAVTQAMS